MSLLFLLWMAMFACDDLDRGPFPVEGTTWRVDEPVPSTKGDVIIDLFARRTDCINAPEVDEEDIGDCIPRVDRGSGQVMFGFRLIDRKSSNVLYLPLRKDQVSFTHDQRAIAEDDWELIPHEPMRAGQLFVLLLDGTSSIYETGGINKVEKALLTPAVIESFLPKVPGETTGVLLLRFNVDVKTIDGKDPLQAQIIEDRKVYRKLVTEHLKSPNRGYSHTYDALTFATTKLLESPNVRNWLQINNAQPTVVLLTDGYHNERAQDVCKDNVPRLNNAIESLFRARAAGGSRAPRVFTVGLGKAILPNFKLPVGGNPTVDLLCGRFAEDRIDGGLEARIDNPSLAWLAEVGGGQSFIKSTHKGLADVFLEAAAQRYKWYEIRYQIDPFHHRRSFETVVRLGAFGQAESKIRFHPSAWMDAPSGVIEGEERWFTATPFRRSTAFLMVALGAFVFVGFLGPASFNARRALFRRPRGR